MLRAAAHPDMCYGLHPAASEVQECHTVVVDNGKRLCCMALWREVDMAITAQGCCGNEEQVLLGDQLASEGVDRLPVLSHDAVSGSSDREEAALAAEGER